MTIDKKPTSDKRVAEIEAFASVVRAAGARLAPAARDAERIRRIAEELGAGVPAVKKWYYAQNAPRGSAARVLLREIEALGVIFDGAKIK